MTRSATLRTALSVPAVLALAMVLASCGPRVPASTPTVSGVIREVSEYPGGMTVLVYGAVDIDRIAARVDTSTVLLREKGGRIIEAIRGEVVPGSLVDVWIDGPLAESYPAQGRAATLLIRQR